MFPLALLLAAAPVDPSTVELVFSLAGADREKAETALVAKGPEGVLAASWVLRAGGPPGFVAAASEPLMCPSLQMQLRSPRGLGDAPSAAAARWLLAQAKKDPVTRRALGNGPSGVERLTALAAAWDDAAALDELVAIATPPVWRDDELSLLGTLQQCSMMSTSMALAAGQRGGEDLKAKMAVVSRRNALLKKLREQARPAAMACVTADDAAALAKGTKTVRVRGWGTSGDEFSAQLDLGDAETKASGTCLVALYAALKTKDLLVPTLLTAAATHPPTRDRALALLEADLDAFDKNEQQNVLRVLLKNGRASQRLGSIEGWIRERDTDYIEAGLRAKDPLATRHLLAKLSCPSGREVVKLLPLLKDKRQAANEAARVAEKCPEFAAQALVVLLDLKDPRWAKFLALGVADRFGRMELADALLEHWSPAVKAKVLDLKLDAETKPWLDELLRRAERR